MIVKESIPGNPRKLHITFALPASIWADSIHLVGDFNQWSTTATPLYLDDTSWSITLDLDKDQAYQYRYLVNNSEWMSDWSVDYFTQGSDGVETSVVVAQLPHATVPADAQPPTIKPMPIHLPIHLPTQDEHAVMPRRRQDGSQRKAACASRDRSSRKDGRKPPRRSRSPSNAYDRQGTHGTYTLIKLDVESFGP